MTLLSDILMYNPFERVYLGALVVSAYSFDLTFNRDSLQMAIK